MCEKAKANRMPRPNGRDIQTRQNFWLGKLASNELGCGPDGCNGTIPV